MSMWMRWYVDSFETVVETAETTRSLPFKLRMAMNDIGTKGKFHIAVEGKDGDSAGGRERSVSEIKRGHEVAKNNHGSING